MKPTERIARQIERCVTVANMRLVATAGGVAVEDEYGDQATVLCERQWGEEETGGTAYVPR